MLYQEGAAFAKASFPACATGKFCEQFKRKPVGALLTALSPDAPDPAATYYGRNIRGRIQAKPIKQTPNLDPALPLGGQWRAPIS